MPNRRWLVAAFCDESTDKHQIESDIYSDYDTYKAYSKRQPYPYSILPDFIWFDVNDAKLKPNSLDYETYVNYTVVIPSLERKFLKACDYDGLVLLLDRDLLRNYGLSELYLNLVTHNFFKPKRNPCFFACCFGGTPQNGMRCDVVPTKQIICANHAHACSACISNDKLLSCGHTCYWFFIGLVLRAFQKPKQVVANSDEGIKQALPPPYIYN